MGRKKALTVQQEKILCDYINHRAGYGCPLIIDEVCLLAGNLDKTGRNVFGEKGPSKQWWWNFNERHKDDIILRKADRSERDRDLSACLSDFQQYLKTTKDDGHHAPNNEPSGEISELPDCQTLGESKNIIFTIKIFIID